MTQEITVLQRQLIFSRSQTKWRVYRIPLVKKRYFRKVLQFLFPYFEILHEKFAYD